MNDTQTENKTEESKSTMLRINRAVNTVLLLLIILLSGVYLYITIPAFFDDPIPPPPPKEEVSTALTEETKKELLDTVTDPIENDEGGMMNVLKQLPKNTPGIKLTDDQKNKILEGSE